MDSKKPLYKSIPFWAVVLFLFYSALGFLAVPYFIKKEITLISSSELNSKIYFDSISFNPYSFTVQLAHLKLTDVDSTVWFSADKLLINLGLFESVFSRTNISEITLDNPHYLLILKNKNNTTQLKYPKIKPTDSQSSEALDIDIGNININNGSLSYLDSSSHNIVDLKFKEIGFKHIGFSTDDKHSTFDLSLLTDQGDKAEFIGTFNFAQFSSSGNWILSHFSTDTVFKIIADSQQQFYGFKNQSGSLSAKGEFSFNSNNEENIHLKINTLKLENFSATSSEPNQPIVKISELQLNQGQIDLHKKQLTIADIDLQNTEISASFSENNQLLWNDPVNQQSPIATDNSSESDWQYTIDSIKSKDALLVINKIRSKDSIENRLQFSTAEINNLTSHKQQDMAIKITVIPDNEGVVELQVTLQTQPLKIDSIIDANNINLLSSQAWIPDDIQIIIESGTLSMHQKFNVLDDEYQSIGWVKLNDLSLLDNNNQNFLKITQLEFTENAIDSSTKTIDLNNIKLDKAEANLIVSDKSTLNINTIISDSQDKQKIKDEIKDAKNDWLINIKQVELIDLKTSFIDRSIKPSYQSSLTKINGTINDLSSANTSKANVNIKGVLDTYAKFDVLGKINPLSDKAYTDLEVSINNLDLQNFSTYSTKFLGFPINRGKADFKLYYKLNQSLLKGINDLKFHQLQLGNKVQNDNAINLPLKLAISLLTNNKGIMAINLPVSGRVDDPEFSYGGLVFKAFFKLITGIVASPFKLLGKLIPAAANLDMSSIQFQPGTTKLIQGEEEKLKAMQAILEKRPSIILELSSTINTTEDYKALNSQLLLEYMKLDSRPDLSEAFSIKILKKSYIKLLNPEQWQTLESNASKDGILNHTQLAESAWNDLLQTLAQDTTNQLEIIGKQRTQQIQRALIEDFNIPEKRIFLKPTEKTEKLTPQVKFGIAN